MALLHTVPPAPSGGGVVAMGSVVPPAACSACGNWEERLGCVAAVLEMGRWSHPLPPTMQVGPGTEKGEISPANAFGSRGVSGLAEIQKQQ